MGPAMIVAGSIAGEAEGTLPGGLAGIPKEFFARLEELRGTPGHNYADESNIVSYLGFKMAEDAGVELILSAYAADPIVEDGSVCGLFVEGKSGRVAVRAKVVVDATGDADMASRAGVPIIAEVPPDPSYALLIREPYIGKEFVSWNDTGILYLVGGVNLGKYNEFISRDVALSHEDQTWAEGRLGRFPKALVPALREAWESGQFKPTREIDRKVRMTSSPSFTDLGNGVACSRVNASGEIHSKDMAQISKLEAALRVQAFEWVRFLRNHAPGFEGAYALCMAPFLGTRGGPCIEGEHTLTPEEAFNGERFDDVLYRNMHEGLHGGDTSGFDVSYGMLLPKGLDGLLVTGRGAAYLRRGHDPTGMRARPSMMILGQATGTAAALAAKDGVTPRNLDIKRLQKALLQQGLYLGDERRLVELGLKYS